LQDSGCEGNIGAKRATAAGCIGPNGDNVPRTVDRAKVACCSASG
jgi:hypothetical protein